MSFERDMKRFKEKVAGASEAAIRATALELGKAIIYATPVGNPDKWESVKEWQRRTGNSGRPPWLKGYIGGTARGNWQTSVVSRPKGETGLRDANLAVAELNLAAASYTLASTIHIANNLPYISSLERGSSFQAPRGMVQTNIDAFSRVIDQKARKHRI